jgi:NitT/TauT family transport system ATP-binding protein
MNIVDGTATTSLFVTHNIAEAIFLADEVMVMTPRPGKLARIVEVPFERPRSLELQLTPEFNKIESEVRNILGSYV